MMRSVRDSLMLLCAIAGVARAQEPAILQTPREALIEMFTGGGESVKKHLTVAVQQKLGMNSTDTGPLNALGTALSNGGVQTFESGPVLFTISNPQQNQRTEVRIDNEYLHGEADDMELSFHSIRDGKEENLPVGFRMVLGLVRQENIWRLNTLNCNAKIQFGDPRLYDGSMWTAGAAPGPAATPRTTVQPQARAKLPPTRAIRQILLAEDLYARKHPEAGFTCEIKDLINIGKGFDNGESYTYLDPEFGQAAYNGYHFSLSGCAGHPASDFQVTAEPVSGSGKAYCSDAGRTVRSSDDGRGATCLESGQKTLN